MRSNPKLQLAVQLVTRAGNLPDRSRLRRWARAAAERHVDVTLRIVDTPEARRLNREFRGKDYPTNVLTFPYVDTNPLSGDVVLCAPVVAQEARRQRKPLDAHYAHLVVHGILHLQGYDHEDDADAQRMEARETEIVMQLGYPDPYAVVA